MRVGIRLYVGCPSLYNLRECAVVISGGSVARWFGDAKLCGRLVCRAREKLAMDKFVEVAYKKKTVRP